ncbi:hypothetical protein K523DRAFT_150471 [Schizophyllum commune Tattone D]|nr:hypothetical protein K523DRAFT_150471 [Schizophyllum commune Tattone D]
MQCCIGLDDVGRPIRALRTTSEKVSSDKHIVHNQSHLRSRSQLARRGRNVEEVQAAAQQADRSKVL